MSVSVASRQANESHRCFLPIILALTILLSSPVPSGATELDKKTLAAWDGYVRSARLRVEGRAKSSSFLRLDELPDNRFRVRAGGIPVWPEAGTPMPVPRGLIHDWIGAVFIPKATIPDVFAITRDYGRYAEIYKPAVLGAEGLGSTGNDYTFSMTLSHRVFFVTAVLKGDYETQYIPVDARRWYSISRSTRLQAVDNFGQPDMRVLPPDHGPGYIWRLYSFASLEERDGGVYIEMEALGLSRDVPVVFRWLLRPLIERLPRNSIRATLEETRDAVLAKISAPD